MIILYLKALHLIAVVAWFSGLFYVGRMFIYLKETENKNEIEKEILRKQLLLMSTRAWKGICWPAMIASIVLGLWLMTEVKAFLQTWFHIKFILIIGLCYYHLYNGKLLKKFKNNAIVPSTIRLRFLNEIPTGFLIAITFTVIFKDIFNGLINIGIFVVTLLILYLIIKIMNKKKV